MAALKRLYYRSDEWAKGLSQRGYAVLLGVAGCLGWLVTGLVASGTVQLLQALTFGLVMFGMESVFGFHQTDGE